MPPLLPNGKPRLSTADLEASLRNAGIDPAAEPLVVAGRWNRVAIPYVLVDATAST